MCTTGMFSRPAAMLPITVFVSPRKTAAAGRSSFEHRVELRDDGADDLGVGLADGAELDVRRIDVELAEEDVLQVVRVVLPGPDEDDLVARLLLEAPQDQRRADQIRADAEDDRDLPLAVRRQGASGQNQRIPSRCSAARASTTA